MKSKLNIPDDRYWELMENDDLQLTDLEIEAGWHFCPDWDGLLIGPNMDETQYCTCS